MSMKRVVGMAILVAGQVAAQGRLESHFSAKEFALSADPGASQWKKVAPVVAENDRFGKPVAGHRMEIRSRWTKGHLYILFVCPFERLYLKPSPVTDAETNKLWDWDVAETFIGTDFEDIGRYRELQVSPQGEWVDLDIDKAHPKPEGGRLWNSGFTVKARVDHSKKIWYGEMKIPLKALYEDPTQAATVKVGTEMRINCFRIQDGPGEARKYIAWQTPNNPSFHTPSAFGRLVLVK